MAKRPAQPPKEITFTPEQEAEREKCRTDLLHLGREYLNYGDLSDVVHGGMVRHLNEYLGKCKKWNAARTTTSAIRRMVRAVTQKEDKYPLPALFLVPRNHLKTSLLTIAWVIQQILINQNVTIRILSYGWGRSVEIMTEIKDQLKNPKLVELFPDILWPDPKKNAPKWGEDALTVKRTKVVSGYTVKVDSIMGGITGAHCEIMVFDDLHDIENTETAEQIRKVIQRFRNCRSVLKPGGLRIIIGTIWKRDDFYAWCKDQGFEIYRRVATYNSKGEECDCDDPDAHPYFPELFTIEELRQRKAEIGRAFFSCQYNLQALAEEDIKFTEEMIRYYKDDPPYRRIWILVDPALSRTKKADDQVICVVGRPKEPGQKLKVIKSKGLRLRPRELIDAILEEYIYYSRLPERPDMLLGVEQAAMQYVLSEWIKEAMQAKGIFAEVVELKHGNRPKPERANKLLPLFENGAIELHESRCTKLVQQLLDFGASTKDDHADALAYLPDVLDEDVHVQVFDTIALSRDADDYDPDDMENMIAEMELATGRSWKDF